MKSCSLCNPYTLVLLICIVNFSGSICSQNSDHWLKLALEDYTVPEYPAYVSKAIEAAEKEGNILNWLQAYNEQYFIWLDEGESNQSILGKLNKVILEKDAIGEIGTVTGWENLGWLYNKLAFTAYALGSLEAAREGYLQSIAALRQG